MKKHIPEDVTHYNKLIRDKIPAKMEKANVAYEVRTLRMKEFEQELFKKVGEEASGLLSAKSRADIVEELADVLDVIDEIKRFKKIRTPELQKAQKEHGKKKGGFKKRLFLLWSANNDNYKTNERTYKGKKPKKS